MPRVLHITEYTQGGIVTYLKALLGEQLQDPDWNDFHVLTSQQHSPYLDSIPTDRLLTYDYPQRSISNLRKLFTTARTAVIELRPDIVHLHSTFAGLVGRLPGTVAPLFRGKKSPKIVYTSHGWSFRMDCPAWKKSLYANVERGLGYRADRVICVSNDELAAAEEIGIRPSKGRMVFNSLPVTPPAPEPVDLPDEIISAKQRGELVLLFIGRFDKQKGLDLLLAAMEKISDKPVWLLCAGGQVVNGTQHRFSPKAINLGWAKPGQITWLLDFCDLLIAPSRWEAFGFVAAEGLRASRAVICSSAGGLTDIVRDGVNGIVLPALTPDAIADTLSTINKEQLPAMGQAGREIFLKEFTSPVLYQKTRDVYAELMAEKAASR
ncbi:glycosyltransferase [Planctomicrobium sp. SH527]|uniref:glycosyltransferase n=1 Tax=Planctomicrobium sp. SH527 TaxID=3448123 RepID=UPI003F5CB090